MRKRIIVLLSILLAIVLMGCGEDTAAASADTDSIESAISNALADEVPILLVSVSETIFWLLNRHSRLRYQKDNAGGSLSVWQSAEIVRRFCVLAVMAVQAKML